jgi:NADPH-dependent curcumin reductase CurA
VAVQLTNRRVTLAARPVGFPEDSDFRLEEDDVGEPGPGEVLVRTLWLSVDPYQRGRMSEVRSYARSLELGDVITSQAVGEAVESNDPRFERGDHVVGQLGWQEYAVARAGTLRKVVPDVPLQANLHVLGTNGLTAYFGLFDVGRPRPGDTVVVSAAAGAVGQLVGQLAKLGGYDAAIDYKDDDLRTGLKEACPDGVDVYFDNVGGDISAAVHSRLNVGARIAICGQVSQYNLEQPEPTFHPSLLIVFRARMEGFLVNDYASRFGEALPRLASWLAGGDITYTEDVTEGLENAPDAFMRMLRGENRGKALVKLG